MPTSSPSRERHDAIASPTRACRCASSPMPRSLKPDADGLAPCDIVIEKERIAAIGPAAAANDGLPRFDLDRGIVLPRLVDVHTHIDKGHIWARAPNPDGTLHGRAHDRDGGPRGELVAPRTCARRMDFALRCAFAHGTGALRTHIDSYPQADRRSRGACSPRCASSGKAASRCRRSSLYPVDMRAQRRAAVPRHGRDGREARRRCSAGSHSWASRRPQSSMRRSTRCSRPRRRTASISISMSTKATHRTRARSARIAEAALRHKFYGQDRRRPLLLARARRRQRARHHHRQGGGSAASRSCRCRCATCTCRIASAGRTPRWRGVAPLHELDAAGVTVMVASDNTRDPFYAYGDLDMLEVYREATRILHFDHSDAAVAEDRSRRRRAR